MSYFNTGSFLKSLEPLYHEKRWDEAIAQLSESKDHLQNWLYHYNLGTIYVKKEEYGAGRYHLEMALSEGAPRTDALVNLEYVLSRVPIADFGRGYDRFDQFLSAWLQLPASLYLSLSLVCILLVVALIFFQKLKRKSLIAASLLCCLLPIGVDQLWARQHQVGIVLQQSVVLEGPSGIFEEKFEIPAGAKILLAPAQESAEWLHIIKPLRLSGWIARDQVGLLTNAREL